MAAKRTDCSTVDNQYHAARTSSPVETHRTSSTPWPVRAGLAIVFLTQLLLCLRGIANDWYWGHDGYNGASFSLAARNSLEHGILGVSFETARGGPAPSDRYVTHPLLMHLQNVAAVAVFGESPAVLRALSATYVLATLLLLFVAVGRRAGPKAGLAAAAAFVLVPLNGVYANTVMHDHGCIFWSLLAVHLALAWLEDGRRRTIVAATVAMLLALSFDWPAYFVAGLVAAVGLAHPRRRWRGVVLAAVSSVSVAASAAVHIAHVISVLGSLDALRGMYALRTGAQADGWLSWMARWVVEAYGPVALLLLATWLLSLPGRIRRGSAGAADALVAVFLLTQLIHSTVFRQGGMVHRFWLLHGAVAVAAAAGPVLARAVEHVGSRAGAIVAAGLASAAIVPQAAYAWDIVNWGSRTGALSVGRPDEPYDDSFDEIEWVKDLGRLTRDSDPILLLDEGLDGVRVEWLYHLGAPAEVVRPVPLRGMPGPDGRHFVMLSDLFRTQDFERVRRLAAGHPVILHDRRFAAIDLSTDGPSLLALARVEHEPSVAWRWLVNPWRPPVAWVDDPSADSLGRWLQGPEPGPPTPAEGTIGGDGGEAFAWRCPPGLRLAAVDVKMSGGDGPAMVDAVRPVCAAPGREPSGLDAVLGPLFGARPLDLASPRPARLGCGRGLVVALHGTTTRFVTSLGVTCEGTVDGPAAGTPEGTAARSACPDGTVAVGLSGRAGALVDAVSLSCAREGGS